jgi:hypothetical protein
VQLAACVTLATSRNQNMYTLVTKGYPCQHDCTHMLFRQQGDTSRQKPSAQAAFLGSHAKLACWCRDTAPQRPVLTWCACAAGAGACA